MTGALFEKSPPVVILVDCSEAISVRVHSEWNVNSS